MKIYHSLEEYRQEYDRGTADGAHFSAVTLGKFDGVHIGHTKLISHVTDLSRKEKLTGIVFAIDMQERSILSRSERREYLESLGVDVLIECPFSREFMSMSADAFAADVLRGTLHARNVTVGPDYTFGYRRGGDAGMLSVLGRKYGYHTDILEKARILGADVSSTRVRQAVMIGDMRLTSLLLGRPYPVSGTVAHGRHIGTGIGYPTVNVMPGTEKLLPPDGVYASVTHLPGGMVRRGITNIGVRPTVGGHTRRAETTLFDFSGDIYGADIRTDLIAFIRPERTFPGLEALKAQIAGDILKAEDILRRDS